MGVVLRLKQALLPYVSFKVFNIEANSSPTNLIQFSFPFRIT